MSMIFDTPIILIVYNRTDLVQKQLEILKTIKPTKILIICDAPRDTVEGDTQKVDNVKKMIDSISWNCEIFKNYADKNMGCDKRISSGLDWAFTIVDSAIILEDDCIPSRDFFFFCRELLKRYKDDERIHYISGTNFIRNYTMKASYLYTYRASTWGWATWKRAWDTFDYNEFVANWDEEKKKKIKWPYSLWGDHRCWIRCIEINRMRSVIPWDFCWFWHVMKNNGLSIVPCVNLIENEGFRVDATHTTERPEKYEGHIEKMNFPLKHPEEVIFDKRYYFENWKYEKPNYLKKLVDIDFYKRQWKKLKMK